MKKISYMICATLMVGAVAACGNAEDVDMDDRYVRVSAAMADSRAVAKSDFEHEDSISLFFWASDNGDLQPSPNEYIEENNPVYLNHDVWVTAKNMFWSEKEGVLHHFVGVFPYDRYLTFEDLAALPVDNSKDLLLAVKKGVKRTMDPVSLSFEHVLGKVVFNFEFKGFDGEILEISALELEGVKSMAVLDCYGAEPRLDVKEDIATLSLLPEEGLTENTCETVLIPQEDVRISLTMNGKKYTYSGDHINVEAAKVTEVNLRVNNLGEKITLTGDVTIKPWEEDGNYDFEFETVDISSSEWTVEEAGDMVIDGKD